MVAGKRDHARVGSAPRPSLSDPILTRVGMERACGKAKAGRMQFPAELVEIEQALLRQEVTAARAADLIHAFRSKRGAPWTWKEWKKERAALIGSECRQCSSTDGPFVLQHLVQLGGLGHYVYALWVKEPEFQAERAARAAIGKTEKPIRREACPSCERTTIYFRSRSRTWKCSACKHEFTTPTKVMALSPEQKRRIAARKQAAFEESKLDYQSRAWDAVGHEAVLKWLAHYREYLAFTHATTFCKRCAFLWDEIGSRVCRSCGYRFFTGFHFCPKCETAAPTREELLARQAGA
ncbi:MAG: hypothetical protein HS104_11615 [Polyangiaceae bacterium]|nr:hypothetical protein [Polyangiaceae bacterium]MCL4748574.1 hypothetical protein [Myxococcales bacterium]